MQNYVILNNNSTEYLIQKMDVKKSLFDNLQTFFGFDNFKGFSKISPQDGPEYPQSHKRAGGFSPESYYEELMDAIGIFDEDRFVGWKKRIELCIGDVAETVPKFVKENPGLRISLLHFDIDLYEPTRVGLEHLFPLVVPGGIVIFDEYGILEWSGESKAVEEYFKDKPAVLKKFEWNNVPGAYLVKSLDG